MADYKPVPGVRRYQSSACVLGAIGFGLPLLLLSAPVGWVVTLGYPQFIVVASVLASLGARGVYLSGRGGVDVAPTEVTIRGWFRTERISVDGLRAVVGRRNSSSGLVAGWLVTNDDREHRLRGVTSAHRHGLGRSRCEICVEEADALSTMAGSLELPLLDGGTWSPFLPRRR